MATLSEQLLDDAHYGQLIEDCVALIESHVASKKGLSGAGVKTAFKVLKSVKKGILNKACRFLMPDFAVALDPIYEDFKATDEMNFSAFLERDPQPAVDALLGVTDSKVASLDNPTVQKVYGKLRGGAEAEVMAALPGLGAVASKYIA